MKPQALSVLILVALATQATEQAHALPIFSENRAIKLGRGVVLYPDSDDPHLVYYFPGHGQLRVQEGLPAFGFTYWGLRKSPTGEITYEADSGALLSFSAHLTFTPEQKEEVEARIGSGMRVAILPIQKSTIGLTTTATDGKQPMAKFFEEFNFAKYGGQADADIGVNAILTGLGARTFAAQIKNPSILKIDYCYDALGLTPEFSGDLTLDWSQTFETVRTSFSAGNWFHRREVSVTLQKLLRDGTLKINISKKSGDSATQEEWLMGVADLLMARMFMTEIPVGSGSGSGGSLSKISLDYNKSYVRETVRIEFKQSLQTLRTDCVPVMIDNVQKHFNQVVQTSDGVDIFGRAQ